MSPAVALRLRLLASVISVLALVGALAVGWFYWRLRASLPLLDGAAAVSGLSAEVVVTRDELGVPTIRGTSRNDVARALGFLHGQERFFQMDTLRRQPAGELAEIVGQAALNSDRRLRAHGFRALAEKVLMRLPPADRELLDAYTAGVNTGLDALGAKPWEYYALRVDPAPWRPADTILVAYAMTLDLQERASTGIYERSITAVRDTLGNAALAFFAPTFTPDDAALDGTTAPLPPIPTSQQLNLRRKMGASAPDRPSLPIADSGQREKSRSETIPLREFSPGSNNFALAGRHTMDGAALLASDMHLDLAVPNIWYRARLEWPGASGESHHVTGVTLPGVPFMVAGSNGRVAWSFTNSNVDTSDLVVIEVNVISRDLYAHEGKMIPFEKRREKILVKGEDPVEIETTWSVWGPVVGINETQRPLALRWVGYDVEGTNCELRHLETAQTLDQAVAVAHRAGMPAQNIVLGDAEGRIAWTIAGRLPKRRGFDGRLPVSWLFGDRGWDGLLPSDEVPTLVAPRDAVRTPPSDAAARAGANGHLYTANARVLGGAAFTLLGDGGYERPYRAAQLRERLENLVADAKKAAPADLLAIQLDDRALFLNPWQKELLAVLTPDVVAEKKPRAELRSLVEHWDGRASVDSVSFRLVRMWRERVGELVFAPIFAPCIEEVPNFDWSRFNSEPALRALLREQPLHLLDPRFGSWKELLVTAADDVVSELDRNGIPLAKATWGRRNTARIRHPLGASLPDWLAGWLHMPPDQLPGATDMPRVQGPSSGASQRFVVAPGREAEGIYHMPGGQSGHPLSPFYRAGHEAWVRGEPTPFLPGETKYTLTLRP